MRQGSGNRRRQQNADHLLAPPARAQTPGKENGPRQHRDEAKTRGSPIGHGEAKRVAASSLNEGTRERLHIAPAAQESIDTQFLNNLAHLLRRGRRRQRLSEGDANRIRNTPRELPEKAAAGKTEDGAPDAINIYGNDGCIRT